MDACDLVCAIPVVVAVIGLIVWMAAGFEQASRENDWPPLRRAGDDEPARSVAPPDTGGVGSAPTPAMRAMRAPGRRL